MVYMPIIDAAFHRCILFLSLLLISNFSFSQNLLTNGNFEQGNGIGFSSNYGFIPAPTGTTSAGQYGIGTNPQPFNTSSFVIMGDHTTGTGNMMIVDGTNNSGNPEPFFWRVNNNGEICGLTPGVKYTFSYWIRSVYNAGIPGASVANIGIKWNNVQGQSGQGFLSPTSGSVFAPNPGDPWQKVTYEFIPTNACVRIEMFNWNASLAGNDFAIDDLELIPPPEPLSISASLSNVTCPGANDGSIVAYGKGGTLPYLNYSLSGSASQTNTTGIFTNLAPGTYDVSVTDQNSQKVSLTSIVITQPADLTVTADKTSICSGDAVNLSASGVTSYNWSASPSDPTLTTPTISNPVVRPTQTTTYTATSSSTASQQLIYNGDFSLGDKGFYTDYKYYAANSSGLQRAYGIVSNASTWFNGFSGCTGYGGIGNMIVFDGSTVNNDKVWCQKVPVKPGQTYTFSYYVQSLVANNPANLEVQINGIRLTSATNPQSASSTLCLWEPRTYTWSSGANTIADICIYNRVTTSAGNDFALDDILFTTTLNCNLTKSVTVNVNNNTVPTFPTYGPYCQGAILTQPILPATSNNNITGSWSPAGLSANTAGNITYTFTPDAGQCAAPYSFVLKVNPSFTASTSTTQNTVCGSASCTYAGKKVVINELHIQPSSTVGNQMILRSNLSVGSEWIELYNPSPCQAVDLSCHMIGNYSTEGSGSVKEPAILFLPPGTIIPPLGFLTIGGGASVATLKPSSLINGLVGNQLYLPGGIFDGGWIGIWDVNGAAIDAVYWMDGTRNINSGVATASFTTSPGTITNANVPFSCPYRGTLPTARELANSGGPITRIGNIASNGTYQFRTSDGANTWTFNNVANTPSACNSTCATPFTGGCNGTATVNVTGGTGPFIYQWNDPAAQTTQIARALCAGNYTVTVKDANNACTQTANITVTDNCCTTITNPSVAQNICQTDDPAEISVSTSATGTHAIKFVYFSTQQTGANMYTGGTLLKNVTPSSGVAKFDTTALAPGKYYIYAILNPTPASTTCRPFQEIVITVNQSITPSFDAINPICSGGSFTLPTTSKNGVTGTWLPAINNTTTTNYTFTPDDGQCALAAQLTVTVITPNANLFSQDTVRACGTSYTLDAGVGFSSYSWSTGATTQNVNVSSTGWYKCTVTQGACTARDSVFVSLVEAKIINNDTAVCKGTIMLLSAKSISQVIEDTLFVEKTSMNMFQPFSYNTSVLQPGIKYFLKVSGTVGFAGNIDSQDGAYQYNFFGNPVIPYPFPSNNSVWWSVNGNNLFRPSPDVYNPNHIYFFNYIGSGQVLNISWSDSPFGDNSGQLNFELYMVKSKYSILWSTGETTPSIIVSPAQTNKYYVTVSNGISSCIDSVTVTVNQPAAPIFTQIQPICNGSNFNLLTTSTNGITGSWSPSYDNTQTTTYTFTPNAGQCARDTTMMVVVNQPVASVFTQIDTICRGGTISLPNISNNGITGNWAPAFNNTQTTTYTFTPDAGQCATTTTMTVAVRQKVVPVFNQYGPFCQNAPITLPTLPAASNNGIAGTWSPGSLSTAIAGNITYSFTPATNECATPTTITVAVNPEQASIFTQIIPICNGGAITLPTISNNSITGLWSPSIDNTQTTTYTFTPNAGQCTRDTTMIVVVNQPPSPPSVSVSQQPDCNNSTGAINISGLPSGNWVINPGNISGSGNSYSINNVVPGSYSYSVRDVNGCTSPLSNSVTINAASAPPAIPVATVTRQPDCVNKKGSITVTTPTGPNLVYSLNGGTPQSSLLFDDLDGGSYRIEVENTLTGCKSQPSVFYTINAAPLPSVPPFVDKDEEYCVGDRAVPVRALGRPQGQLLWYTNATGGTGSTVAPTPSTVRDGTTIYYVTQRLPGFCESQRVPLTVIVYPKPLVNAGGDKEIVRGQRTTLDGTASGTGISVLWTPGFGLSDAKITTPVASPEQTTVYTITVTSLKGCKSTDNMRVVVKDPRVVKIPNVISPNGDGVYDRWVIGNIDDYPDAEVQIFNRYGTQVYEVRGYNNASGWEGKLNGVDLPVGAYYYIIRLNGKVKPIAGVISIIR